MQFWVYLLRCADGSYYTGHTEDLEGRLWQHRQGICCEWTRRRRPVELVWCEAAPTRHEALAFERRVKGWTRAKKEALIGGDWDRISWLAKPPQERQQPIVRPERSEPKASVVEGRSPPASEKRPSTSLRTNEVEDGKKRPVRPERSAERVVEGRPAPTPELRPSTSLRTNGSGQIAERQP